MSLGVSTFEKSVIAGLMLFLFDQGIYSSIGSDRVTFKMQCKYLRYEDFLLHLNSYVEIQSCEIINSTQVIFHNLQTPM